MVHWRFMRNLISRARACLLPRLSMIPLCRRTRRLLPERNTPLTSHTQPYGRTWQAVVVKPLVGSCQPAGTASMKHMFLIDHVDGHFSVLVFVISCKYV